MKPALTLPGTDLTVSRIGLGTVNAGLDWDGEDAYRIFDEYVALGGNLIDSARIYSDWAPPEIGRSERVIGDWLRRRGRHNDVILITKGGHPCLNAMSAGRMRQADMDHDIARSLNTLGVDCIDLYIYHRDDPAQPVGELIERMEGYVRQGKIRYYGCSNWSASRLRDAVEYADQHGLHGFVANQMLFNLGTKHMRPYSDPTMAVMDAAMLRLHRERDVLAMPYFGLCGGYFHRLCVGNEGSLTDSPYDTAGNRALLGHINALRERYRASVSQILIGFYFAHDLPIVPLAGCKNLQELRDIMQATSVTLSPDDYHPFFLDEENDTKL